ncbi:shikimate kinase, partial [Bacillus sp. SRB_28]
DVESICNIFRSQGVDIYFVELEADVEERLQRNKTPNRLEHKPTKRNIEQSEQNLLSTFESFRLNSKEGEITEKNYIRINNTNINATEVAQI